MFGAACSILGLVKINKRLDIKKVRRILIIKIWALGDSVVLLPTIKAIKDKFPNIKIDVLAHKSNKAVFEGQEFIDNIIEFSLPNILRLFKKYDLCIDAEPFANVSATISFLSSSYSLGFSHGVRSKVYNETTLFNKNQHMVSNYLDFAEKIGIKPSVDKLIPIKINKNDSQHVSEYIRKNNIHENDFVVALVPGVGSSVRYRMWPIDNFAKLGDELIRKFGAKVIFVDSKGNKPVVKEIQALMDEKSINTAGDFSVKQAAEMLRRCKVVVSNDSGMMHVSAAMGTKTIGLFGPNTPALWAPYGKGNVSIWKPKKGCPFIDNTKAELAPENLTKEQITCMDAITVDDVIKAVERIRK